MARRPFRVSFGNVFGAKIIRHTLKEGSPRLIRMGSANGRHRQIAFLIGPESRIESGCSREDPFSPQSEIQRSQFIAERQRCTIDASRSRRSSLLPCRRSIHEEVGHP
jgi:hypothetical protein